MILSKIINAKRKEIDVARSKMPEAKLKELAGKIYAKSSFKRNIGRPHHVDLIAELKKASPSQGIIRGDFNPLKIALTYQANGASALSVLTDERFFEGSLHTLKELKSKVTLPILRKDFIIDEYQIYESLYWGADAILLIANILTEEELCGFYKIAKRLGMDVMVEVHSEEDLEKALKSGASIIGINNRDLNTFRVDLAITQRLIRLIPPNKIKVSESGIKTYEDVMFLKSLGADAVLIGEAFMKADDIASKIREIMRY
ncbi:MAG: indole-3-glycerol phosphate synthase TrpC [Candidatus Omnitrophica bacterium]|nr:indole-3-glycerol phosphate synthase TrpC [Candidatus Omnitrophota bacterium]